MTRPPGVPNKKPYPLTSAGMAQRQSAVLTRRRKDPRTGKTMKDGKLKVLDDRVNCKTCECKMVCPSFIDSPKPNIKCPLFITFRDSVCDIIGNPVSYLAKKAADMDLRIKKQEMLDRLEGKPITPEVMAATKIALQAADIAVKAQKNLLKNSKQSRMVTANVIDENEIIDLN